MRSTMPTKQNVLTRAINSASNIFRRKLCPGSGFEEAKYGEESSEYSESGQRQHAQFMRPDPDYSGLTDDEANTVHYANKLAEGFISQFMEENSIPPEAPFIEEWEVPLVFHDFQNKPLFPGHADYVRTWPEQSARVILDFKSGYLEVTEAADNDQLAAYAVSRNQAGKASVTGVAIIQPNNFGPKTSTAIYMPDALHAAQKELINVHHAALHPSAELVPGLRQCQYCRAKAACHAYTGTFILLAEKKEVAVETLEDHTLIRLWEAVGFADKISKAIRGEMRRRVTLEQLPGFKLRNMGSERKVIDHAKLYQAFFGYFHAYEGWTAKDYDDCRDMGWGKLNDMVRKFTGLSEKKADELIDELCKGCIVETEKAKAVTREKPAALK